MNPPDSLCWPDGLDPQAFLDTCWQRRALLMRGALPGFETPLPPDELAGLSLEPGTTPRLIVESPDGTRFEPEHGPFEEERFERLGDARFSLLVSDVEKHLPELQAWLRPFRFLPDWRIDDLMISYAPDGGSVGAHVDEYDVFLLQASGRRRWSIDTRTRTADDFSPDESWVLEPGDLLYLPPGVPHHGVALGDDCTTWSIGFRAPRRSDVIAGIAERIEEALQGDVSGDDRYRDPALRVARPGEIARDALVELRRLWDGATRLSDERFAELAGRLLTQASGAPGSLADESMEGADGEGAGDGSRFVRADEVRRSGFARIAWTEIAGPGAESSADPADDVLLFADGEALRSSRALALRLASLADEALPLEPLDDGERAVVKRLLELGTLEPVRP